MGNEVRGEGGAGRPVALVVDGDAQSGALLRLAAERAGFRVEEAKTGPDALSAFERFAPELVLLSFPSPGMNAAAVCATLRLGPFGDRTRILAVVPAGNAAAARAAVEAGAADIAAGPADPEFLCLKVRCLLEAGRAAAALRASERRYRTLFDSASDAIYVIDFSGTILEANRAACERLGYRREELVGKMVRDIDAPGQVIGMAERVEELRRRGVVVLEKTNRRKDGSLFPVEVSSRLIEYGGALAVLSISRDITERKQAENALREKTRCLEAATAELERKQQERERLLKLVEAAKREWEKTMDCIGDMVVLADAEGRVRRCNRAFMEFAGRSYAQILGQDLAGLLQELGLGVNACLGKGIESFHEPSGRWFFLKEYEVSAEDGKAPSGTVTTIHDSTELKRTAKELEGKNRQLTEAYAELKAAQARILQSEKMASIGQLAAGVAHEINNPIGFVASNLRTLEKYVDRLLGFVEAAGAAVAGGGGTAVPLASLRRDLRIDRIVADAKSLIRESLEGAERVGRIVRDLKAFSRVDEAQWKMADVNECIESTLAIAWNELKYKAVVKKDLGAIPRTRCNPQQLNQVFMNLLVNAAQAIEKHGEISIRSWQEGEAICVSIADTGSGIRPEHLNRIFEPFFTTKEVGKGTGLGLSITYDIVKKHGGEILVESEVGSGSTFTVRIPIVQEA